MVNPGRDWQILKLCIGNMSKDKNFMVAELRLELTDDDHEYPNKIEICRFRLQDPERHGVYSLAGFGGGSYLSAERGAFYPQCKAAGCGPILYGEAPDGHGY